MSFYTKLAYCIFALFLILWGAFKLYRGNSVDIKINDCADSELKILATLDKTVQRNFLDRNYYEVHSFSSFGPCRIADYDKEKKLLRVCVDPGSGWIGYFKVSEAELHGLVLSKAKFENLHQFCEPYSFETP